MTMQDYITQLDTILQSTGEQLLVGSGTVSHDQAMQKATEEYRKYEVKTLSPIEEEYLLAIKSLGDKAKGQV